MAVRDPSAQAQTGAAGIPPITKSFAVTILVAVALLMVLRKTFGSIRLEVGSS
jgi:hypothetical protein